MYCIFIFILFFVFILWLSGFFLAVIKVIHLFIYSFIFIHHSPLKYTHYKLLFINCNLFSLLQAFHIFSHTHTHTHPHIPLTPSPPPPDLTLDCWGWDDVAHPWPPYPWRSSLVHRWEVFRCSRWRGKSKVPARHQPDQTAGAGVHRWEGGKVWGCAGEGGEGRMIVVIVIKWGCVVQVMWLIIYLFVCIRLGWNYLDLFIYIFYFLFYFCRYWYIFFMYIFLPTPSMLSFFLMYLHNSYPYTHTHTHTHTQERRVWITMRFRPDSPSLTNSSRQLRVST